jgi:hypothetical protein
MENCCQSEILFYFELLFSVLGKYSYNSIYVQKVQKSLVWFIFFISLSFLGQPCYGNEIWALSAWQSKRSQSMFLSQE